MLGYLIYKLMQTLSFILPLKVSYKIAEIIAYFYYLLAKNARRIILYNLNQTFDKEFTSERIGLISINIFKNFAKGLVDFCRLSKVDKIFIQKYVNIKNLHYLHENLKNTGAIGLTAHIGNWELGGIVLAVLGYPVNAVAMPHTRTKVNRFFLRQRSIKGVKVIPVGEAYKQCYEKLLSKELVLLLSDRRYPGRGMRIRCFGKIARIPKGPAVLSLRANIPIVPGYMIRKHDGFDLIFEKPIYPESISGKTYQEKLVNLAQEYTNVMQKYIKKYPEQWLLFHKLFVE